MEEPLDNHARVPPLVGLDLESPVRLAERLARRPGLEERIFTAGERAYCHAQARPELHLAARYCAKEATVKALGLTTFEPLEIEVVAGGAECRLRLSGDVSQRAQELGVELSLSLSHVDEIAGAVVLARPTPFPSRPR